jgi:NADPH2:quinone reductase
MKGSKTVAGFWLVDCLGTPGLLNGALQELFALVADGKLRSILGGDYAMTDIVKAHEDMRARRTVGKLTLDPKN